MSTPEFEESPGDEKRRRRSSDSANVTTWRYSQNLTPQAQGLAVGGATFASLVYGIQTQYWFIPGAKALPFDFWTLCMLLLGIWVLLIVSAGPMKELLQATVMKTEASHDLSMAPRAWAFIWYFLLYVLAFGCVVILAWFTQATGGVLNTPYSIALVAIFAGSVFVARRWWVPFLVLAWTLVMAFYFSDWSDGSAIAIPKWLVFLTVFANAFITAMVFAFKQWYNKWVSDRLKMSVG